MTEFTFSKHAHDQMLLRHISMDEALGTLQYPDDVIKLEDEQYVYQKIFVTDEDSRFLIRIFVNGNRNPGLIKTLYRISKISKYY
jgi:hypothetical protein